MSKRLGLIPLLMTAVLSYPVGALAADPQFSGYVSQGVIYSGDNPFYDDDTGTNFNLRELGLNASWNVSDRLRFAGQLISRKAGDLEDGDPKIDFLLMDYQFLVTEQARAGVRLGRVKNQYGLYNTTRDIPHGRPGVFVPQSVYFDSMRDALLSSEGVNLYLNLSTNFADFSFNVQKGREDLDNNAIEYQLFQQDAPGDVDSIDFEGLKITMEPRALPGLVAGITLIDLSLEYGDYPALALSQVSVASAMSSLLTNPSNYALLLTNQQLELLMSLYSVQYAWKDWILTGEYLNIDIDIENLKLLYIPLPGKKETSIGGYLQLEWLASNQLSAYLRYEELYYRDTDKDGKKYALETGGNALGVYNKALTLGARWYFTPDLSLTAEYSANEGAAFINGQPEEDYSSLEENWDMFILQMSYHF